jgi:pSer/pThr/pTyr-binding forkhead associated (FHA) protein
MAVRLVVRHPKSAAGEAGEVRFEFEQARVVIGRSAGAEVRLPGLAVSETHATIEHAGDHYTLRDAGSTNGTRVNDKPLVAERRSPLDDGDVISIADFTLTFSSGPLSRRPTAPERTVSLARRMLRELQGEESEARQPPFLKITEGPEAGTLVNLGEPPSQLVIGRGEDCDLVLRDVDVSRAHIQLSRDVDGVTARDLDSKNGLDVNGRRLRERRLKHGDTLRIGLSVLVYQDLAEQALREQEHLPDEPFTRPQPRVVEATAPVEVSPPHEPELPDESAQELDSQRPTGPVDLLIFALAVFVLVASAVGLVWLFR